MFSEDLEHLPADDCKTRRDWITRIMLVSDQWPVGACIMLEQLLQYLPGMVLQLHCHFALCMLDRAKARDSDHA